MSQLGPDWPLHARDPNREVSILILMNEPAGGLRAQRRGNGRLLPVSILILTNEPAGPYDRRNVGLPGDPVSQSLFW